MYLIKVILFLTFLLLSFAIKANHRNCLILPINMASYDSSFIYNELENALKRSNWCVFQNSSGLYDLLRKYGQSGVDYTRDPSIMETIAIKTKSKSLIHISEVKNKIYLKVFDGSARPAFIKAITIGENNKLKNLIIEINESLENYSKMIPYEAVVLGVNNNILSASAGHELGLRKGEKVNFIKNLVRKNHPLYHFATGYEYESFCSGYVIQSNLGMSLIEFDTKANSGCANINSGTLVKKVPGFKNAYFSKNKNLSRPKLFFVRTLLGVGSSSTNIRSSQENSLTGFQSDLGIELDVILSNKYIAYSKFFLGMGFLGKEKGVVQDQNPFVSDFEFGGVYKKGLSKGINVNLSLGYNFFNYLLNDDQASSTSELSFNSIALGAKVVIPINKKINLISSFNISLLESAKFENAYLGNVDKGSRYKLYLGADFNNIFKYSFSSGIKIDSINVDFNNDQRDFGATNITLLNSINFNF